MTRAAASMASVGSGAMLANAGSGIGGRAALMFAGGGQAGSWAARAGSLAARLVSRGELVFGGADG